MAKTSHKAVVGYVSGYDVSAMFMDSLLNLHQYDAGHQRRLTGKVFRYSSANISNARNGIVGSFLDESDADWLWMVDTDMVFAPDTLERLLANAHEKTSPIIGGLCFGVAQGETVELFPTLYDVQRADDGTMQTYRLDTFPKDSMLQVAATGAACLLIHRSVFVEMKKRNFNPAFPWFQETQNDGRPVGEDATFCFRAGMCGFPIWVDTGLHIGHDKRFIADYDFYRKQRDPHAVRNPDSGTAVAGAQRHGGDS